LEFELGGLLGVSGCWEFRVVGSFGLLGVSGCWAFRAVGRFGLLGVSGCWAFRVVGRFGCTISHFQPSRKPLPETAREEFARIARPSVLRRSWPRAWKFRWVHRLPTPSIAWHTPYGRRLPSATPLHVRCRLCPAPFGTYDHYRRRRHHYCRCCVTALLDPGGGCRV
jgi:hypothetical protein